MLIDLSVAFVHTAKDEGSASYPLACYLGTNIAIGGCGGSGDSELEMTFQIIQLLDEGPRFRGGEIICSVSRNQSVPKLRSNPRSGGS